MFSNHLFVIMSPGIWLNLVDLCICHTCKVVITNNDPKAVDKLKNLLRRKLLGGVDSFDDSKQEISSLAILSSVIGLDMSPQSQLASELVASHMATCLSVSEDRERLIIAYPSEPLLSEVALEFMSDLTLPKILRLFSTSLKKGLVEPGP